MVDAHACPGNFPEQGSKGNSRDKAARGTGRSGRTMEKAAAIVEAAEAEPEIFGKLQLADAPSKYHSPIGDLEFTPFLG